VVNRGHDEPCQSAVGVPGWQAFISIPLVGAILAVVPWAMGASYVAAFVGSTFLLTVVLIYVVSRAESRLEDPHKIEEEFKQPIGRILQHIEANRAILDELP
jgi:O-antigen/teichoic acid export membrane protein